jgi:hypothetical protein
MTEMRKIVFEKYPVDRLPEEVRRAVDDSTTVTLTVETELEDDRIPLRSFWGAGRGLYGTPEEAVEYIRKLRDEWDD